MENKHTQDDLKMLQALPLDIKIRKTQLRIQEWYEKFGGQVYVSRSGGKDSDVLGDIVKKLYPDVPHVFVNTGLEHDSVRKHGELIADEVIRPEMRFDDVIIKYGYPIISKEVSLKVSETRKNKNGYASKSFDIDSDKNIKYPQYSMVNYSFLLDAPFKISHKCCDVMKKKPAKQYEKNTHNSAIIGTMADESRLRKTKWLKVGCNAFENKRPTSQPLSFWTEQDILHYIKQNNLEIASAYGNIVYMDSDNMQYDNDVFNTGMKLTTTGESRTGCIFCMFGITHDTERFVRLKEREPKKYDYVMCGGKFDENGMWIPDGGLGYKFVIDWLNEHGGFNIKY